MDTQVNESFNNTAAWMAPKNKMYCGSQSLRNRLLIAIGINKLGLHAYYKMVFTKLGIHMTKNVKHFLEIHDNKRNKRLAKLRTKAKKIERLKNRMLQLKEDTVIAQRERAKRDGTYRTGQNLDDTAEEEQPLNKKRKAVDRRSLTCKSCGQIGHATSRARACLNYKGPAGVPVDQDIPEKVDQQLTADDAATDLASYSVMPLVLQEEQQDLSGELVNLGIQRANI
jgi:hypothetical protein